MSPTEAKYNGYCTKLTGSGNYDTWSMKVKAILLTKDADGAIEGKTQAFESSDKKARALITLTVDDKFLPMLAGCETAQEMWEALKTKCRPMNLINRMDVDDEFSRLKKARGTKMEDHLDAIEKLVKRMRDLGLAVDDDKIVTKTMKSLGPEYDSLVLSLIGRDSISLEELNELLRQAATRLEKRAEDIEVAFTSRDGNDRLCFYCNKPGHINRDCRKRMSDQGSNQLGRGGGGSHRGGSGR